MKKRFVLAAVTGGILGVLCIIGANARMDGLSNLYLFSFWLNRLAMGMFIGLLPPCRSVKKLPIRGLIFGLFISFLFYSATEFLDTTGFLAGGIYGIIIEYVTYKKIKD